MFTRGLLLAGYLFLLAGQFNYRYFTIANYYVYSHGGAVNGAGGIAALARTGDNVHAVNPDRSLPLQHPETLRDNTQRPAHLGIDKRFRFQHGIRVPQIRAPGVLYIDVVKTRFPSFAPVYFYTELPTLSLRGPPCA
jgi:hypothetical protein